MENVPLVVPIKEKELTFREYLAKNLFQTKHRLRRWEGSKPWMRKTFYNQADEAMKRSGTKDFTVKGV